MTVRLGRWAWCRECYRNVLPEADSWEGVVACSRCGYGLAPLDDVIAAGSLEAWQTALDARWAADHPELIDA